MERSAAGRADDLREVCDTLKKRDAKRAALTAALPTIRESYDHVRRVSFEMTDAAEINELVVPPDELVVELRLLGWAIYEATRVAVNDIKPAYAALERAEQEVSLAAVEQIKELAHLAQTLPWPEFSLRALGAVRCLALAHSKKDTVDGYVDAWLIHEALDKLVTRRTDEINSGVWSDSPHQPDLKGDAYELAEQHHLAQAGTACREPELDLCRWVEWVESGLRDDDDQDETIIRLSLRLQLGIMSGERAMDLVDTVVDEYEIPANKDEKRLLGPNSKQNPAIMTARAYLLLLPMCPRLADYELPPPGEVEGWDEYTQELIRGFEKAYAQIEEAHPRLLTHSRSLDPAHLRSIIQLRLTYLLLFPGRRLGTELAAAEVGEGCDLDDLDSLSAWLAGQRADANVIGSVNMPEYLLGIDELRGDEEYRVWRERWPMLDRFGDEPGRDERWRRD
ncbi:hypothetical protein [Gordonia alkaliphila]|uniref:Uncharacterized protein n=1 Tax=Gordonia alkaliphila TaxID=1053547 RepID=A0ABP8ZJR5_9ACTN